MSATAVSNRCGLRFDKRDAKKLHALAKRIKVADLTADHAAFEQAAHAAELDEPMVVLFESIEEVAAMVGMYVLHGCRQPTIVELSG